MDEYHVLGRGQHGLDTELLVREATNDQRLNWMGPNQ